MRGVRYVRPERRLGALLLVLVLGVGISGCFTFTPRVDSLAEQIERDLPDTQLERRAGAKAGRLSLGLARSIARLAVDQDEEPEAEAGIAMLSGIKRVEFRSFDRVSEGELSEVSEIDLEHHLGRRGWSTVARVVGDESLAWVMVRFGERRIRSAVVLVLDDSELHLLRVSGRLDRVLVEALRYARRQVEEPGVEEHEEEWQDDWGDCWDERQDGCSAVSSGATESASAAPSVSSSG